MIALTNHSLPIVLPLVLLIAKAVLIEADNGGPRGRLRWRFRFGAQRQRPSPTALRRVARRAVALVRRRSVR